MMTLSVIVPVYNTERYLDRCIQSILAQTYTDFELLLIDDGSTDSSGAICDKYAEKDPRVRVFHTENGGVTSARRLGLGNACGEWIAFVDSDDWLAENYLQDFVDVLSLNVDLVVTNVADQRSITASKFVEQMLMRKLPPQLWGKLYRRSTLKDALCLPRQLYWGEDLVSNVLVGLNLTNRVLLKNSNLYCYDINESSVSSKRASSLDYENYFIDVFQTVLGRNITQYKNAFNYTKLYILEDLIVCKQNVDYNLPWVKELVSWGKCKSLTFRQRMVLLIKNNKMCRYILAVERRLNRFNKHNA